MKELKVRLTFFEEVLGTASADKKIYETFIGSKAPDAPSKEEEVASLGTDEVVEKEKTIFSKDENGNPFLWDYQIKGFLKNAAKAINAVKKDEGEKPLSAYKTKIDNLIFIEERKIPLIMPEESIIGDCQRPLRASTAQGERIALANSETVPDGTYIDMTILAFTNDLVPWVKEWLDYGKWNGIGQWHNSGKGRFLWDQFDSNGNITGGNNKLLEEEKTA